MGKNAVLRALVNFEVLGSFANKNTHLGINFISES